MITAAQLQEFQIAISDFPIQSPVRGNDALVRALGPLRKRDIAMVGTVVDYDFERLRIGVNWAADRNVEYLAPKYLTVVA